MKMYEILKKYYSSRQMTYFPKMFKRIGYIGQVYIDEYEEEFTDELECLKNIARIINSGESIITKEPKDIIETSEVSEIELASRIFKKVLYIYKNAKTGEDIIKEAFSEIEAEFLSYILATKSCGDKYLESYYYEDDDLVTWIAFLFKDEIEFTYKKSLDEITLKNILTAAKKFLFFGQYKGVIEDSEISYYKTLLTLKIGS